MSDTEIRDWDPLDPETFRDPIATYDELRQSCPVAHTDRWGRFWALLRYQDIVRVAADHETFISSVQNLVPQSPRSGVPRRPLQVDPPEHAYFRRIMNPYFEADRVSVLEPGIRDIAARYLGPLIAKGFGDAVGEFARCLPIRGLCAFLHAGEDDATWIQTRSGQYVEAIAADDRANAEKLSGELDQYASTLVASRKLKPLDPETDIISGLLAAHSDAPKLTDKVIAGFVRGLIVAADRSTTNAIGSSILHLAKHPALAERLRREPSRIPDAVEEFVRLYSPSQATARTATRDVEIGGRAIKAGDVVAMVFLAGNHDPEAFLNPDEFILDRKPQRHLGFGHGAHKCAGQSLARLQLRVALEEFLGRTAGIELAGSVAFNTWPEYGPRSLPIRILPRRL